MRRIRGKEKRSFLGIRPPDLPKEGKNSQTFVKGETRLHPRKDKKLSMISQGLHRIKNVELFLLASFPPFPSCVPSPRTQDGKGKRAEREEEKVPFLPSFILFFFTSLSVLPPFIHADEFPSLLCHISAPSPSPVAAFGESLCRAQAKKTWKSRHLSVQSHDGNESPRHPSFRPGKTSDLPRKLLTSFFCKEKERDPFLKFLLA